MNEHFHPFGWCLPSHIIVILQSSNDQYFICLTNKKMLRQIKILRKDVGKRIERIKKSKIVCDSKHDL